MKHRLFAIFCACILVANAIAQSTIPSNTQDSTQIAYKLLAAWADKSYADQRYGKNVATGILAGSGGLLITSAAVTYFAGDSISRSATGAPMNGDLKQNLSLGLGAGGLALVGAGLIVAAVPLQDPHLVWSDVFKENDASLREAMAVSAIRSLAQQGKERRMVSFITSFLVPVLTGGIQVGVNLSQNKVWSDGLLKTIGSSTWSIAGGVASLLTTSPEEKLYERYLVAKSAYQGTP